MTLTITKAEAQHCIDELREGLGGLTEEQRQGLPKFYLDIVDGLRRKLGASTKVLAAELYAKDTRFIYELIQNAEDNQYSIANASSESPWLKFGLYEGRIEIDSNEDGFSKDNIKAICAVGESTKAGATGYVGEKGIGFKSVYKVASKVHVQSGPFSFAFEYNRNGNDNGLGMVTPMNVNFCQLPPGVRTRITLHLAPYCDRLELLNEFQSLPDTLLLFLNKLEHLSVNISMPGLCTEVSYSISRSGSRVSIHKMTLGNPSTSKYWVTKRTVTDMPKDEARKEKKGDEEPTYNTKADVVLAFPLDDHDIPVIEEQHVFAFLPLRKAGYKFLIQSDFITQASREDIFDSAWNRRLLEEVTEAFIESVETFFAHPTLRYHWLRYVPTKRVADDVWGRLQSKLFLMIASWEVFEALSQSGNRKPSDLREVPHEYKDDSKRPLLPDLPKGSCAYLSESYDKEKDLPILRELGLVDLTAADFLDRLEHDLRQTSSDSMMRSVSPDSEWHKKMAQLLLKFSKDPEFLQLIKTFPIVPIKTSTDKNLSWVVPRGATLFFPTTGDIDIPPSLPFNLVDPMSLADPNRALLFSKLGVQECDPIRVLRSIEHSFATGSLTLKQGVEFVRFLFWHHAAMPPSRLKIKLVSTELTWFDPDLVDSGWTYCSRYKGKYSMIKIQIPRPKNITQFNFPHEMYYEAFAKCERRNDLTGIEWFRGYFDLQSTPQLYRRGNDQVISLELNAIAIFHSEVLLGVLQAKWFQYKHKAKWDDVINLCKIPILGSNEGRNLNETFLPLPKLSSVVSRLQLENGFGFLKELEGIEESAESNWTFLKHFGVGSDADVSFWLALLRHASNTRDVSWNAVQEIYSRLQLFALPGDIEAIRSAFKANLIWKPMLQHEDRWVSTGFCVWSAPDWLSYPSLLCLGRLPEYGQLSVLFQRILGIPDANHDHYLEYLAYIKHGDDASEEKASHIPKIYQALHDDDLDDERKERISLQFEQQSLVYYPQSQSWYSPSSCIWAEDNIQLPGKISIATAYKGRKVFFTKFLGVMKPTLELHISALKDKVANRSSKEEVVLEMLNICAYRPQPKALQELRDCKCLPVLYADGTTAWVNRSEIFSVIDRCDYSELFAGKLTLLDMSLEEVHPLKIFLHGLGLADRYMSTAVQEETQTPDGRLHKRLTNDLRKKAYAISRNNSCAAHIDLERSSNGPLAIYRTLQDMEVYVSGSIPSSLSIEQNNNIVTVVRDTGNLHIEEDEGKLRVYVLKNKKRRRVCLVQHLPIVLLKHFGVSPLATGTDLGSILVAGSIFEVDELLKNAGIIEVQGIERPEGEEASDDESCASDDGQSASRALTGVITIDETYSSPGRSVTPLTSFGGSVERPDLYKKLLHALTAHAERLAIEGLPAKHEPTSTRTSAFQGLAIDLALCSGNADERNFKIGAAGELFTYHFLSKLALPNFDRTCWQSTIRDRAALHDDYQDISPWFGHETADIVYTDHQQVLTKLLVRKGYLDPEWTSFCPTYYIEVKATTGYRNTPFFCSQTQLDLMRAISHEEVGTVGLSTSANIYLIARVFSLGDSGTGLYLYVDPEPPSPLGELDFQAENGKYVVMPVVH